MFPWGLHNGRCHSFICTKGRHKSNVLSFSPPGSCRDHTVFWGLLEAFWLLTKAARAVPWGCASQSVGGSETGACFRVSPKIQANGKPWGRLALPPLKNWYAFHTSDIIFATENCWDRLQLRAGWSPSCLHETVKRKYEGSLPMLI